MNGAVHYGHTKRWALAEGFSEGAAETVARADIAVDRIHNGGEWRNWGWHFMLAGAALRARRIHARSLETGDLVALGESLHCIQDSIAHGLLGHLSGRAGIDIWEERSERVRARLEGASRAMLAAYLRRHPGS